MQEDNSRIDAMSLEDPDIPSSQQVDDQQVKRVEGVEQVFGEFPFHETALPVVQADRDEGRAGDPFARQDAAADDRLQDALVAQHVEQQDETIAGAAVVRAQQHGHDQQPQEAGQQALGVLLVALDGAHAQQAEEEGEEHRLESGIRLPIESGQVVDQHGRHGQKLEPAAAENLPALHH